MKKLILLMILIPLIFSGCNDTQSPVDLIVPEGNVIKLVDSISGQPLENFRIELYYLLDSLELENPDVIIHDGFLAYPNPVYNICQVKGEVTQKSNIKILAADILSGHTKSCYELENAIIGMHTFLIDLNDDSLFNQGLFRVYLLRNNVPTDSGNIIRVKLEDLYLLREKQMILCQYGLTNHDGKLIPKLNINKWFGSKIYRTAENGLILNKYQVNDNLLVAVIDNSGKIIKETIVKYNELVERGLTLKIVYYKIK